MRAHKKNSQNMHQAVLLSLATVLAAGIMTVIVVAGGNSSSLVGRVQPPPMGRVSPPVSGVVVQPSPFADVAVGLRAPYTVRSDTTGFPIQIVAFNRGPATAQDVMASLTLPSSLTFASTVLGCAIDGQTMKCSVNTLRSGFNFEKTANVKWKNDLCPTGNEDSDLYHPVMATVSASTQDPNSSNNQMSRIVTLVCQP